MRRLCADRETMHRNLVVESGLALKAPPPLFIIEMTRVSVRATLRGGADRSSRVRRHVHAGVAPAASPRCFGRWGGGGKSTGSTPTDGFGRRHTGRKFREGRFRPSAGPPSNRGPRGRATRRRVSAAGVASGPGRFSAQGSVRGSGLLDAIGAGGVGSLAGSGGVRGAFRGADAAVPAAASLTPRSFGAGGACSTS